MKLIVRCISGQLSGQEWKFDGQGTITIGRSTDSMIKMPQEENTISRQQCIIEVIPPNIYVSDAGSKCGTWVNNQLIGQGGQGRKCQVSNGAIIGIGMNGQGIILQIITGEAGGGQVSPRRFCMNCGRPLAPGEVCQCSNSNNGVPGNGGGVGYEIPKRSGEEGSFGQKLQDSLRRLGGVYKDPIGQAGELAELNDCIPGIIFVCINLIGVFLLGLIVMNAIQYNTYGVMGNDGFMISLYLVLFTALNQFALAGLLLLTSNTFFQAKTTFAGMIGLVGVKAIWDISFLLGGSLLAMASPQLGAVIWVAGALLTWIMLLIGYAEIVPLSGNRKLYSAFIALVVLLLIDILLFRSALYETISELMSFF